jgi:hypothetical protein
MATKQTTTKPSRRQQPAKFVIPWRNRGIPDKPSARRAMLREISRTVDNAALHTILYWGLQTAVKSDERADLAELARIRAARVRRGKAVRS